MSFLKAMMEKEPPEPENPIGTVVIGNLEGDRVHQTAKDLVRKSLMKAQFKTVDLGKNVTGEVFASKAKELNADIIAVSALMMNSVLQLKDLKKAIDSGKWKTKPKLLVGGAPFSIDPELFEHTGADASAPTALVVARECMHLVGVDH